jgi:hypothetical protein
VQPPLPQQTHVHQHSRHALQLPPLQRCVLICTQQQAGASAAAAAAGGRRCRCRIASRRCQQCARRGCGGAGRRTEGAHPNHLHHQLELGQAPVAQRQRQAGPVGCVGVGAPGGLPCQLPLLPGAHILAEEDEAVGAALAGLQEAVARGGGAEPQPLALQGEGAQDGEARGGFAQVSRQGAPGLGSERLPRSVAGSQVQGRDAYVAFPPGE